MCPLNQIKVSIIIIKSGQNRPKNNHLASLILIRDTLCRSQISICYCCGGEELKNHEKMFESLVKQREEVPISSVESLDEVQRTKIKIKEILKVTTGKE